MVFDGGVREKLLLLEGSRENVVLLTEVTDGSAEYNVCVAEGIREYWLAFPDGGGISEIWLVLIAVPPIL